MDDEKILALYFERNEKAISESEKKYGHYCLEIASGILENREDSEECVSDTWLTAWNIIPPKHPDILRLFFGKIARNSAIERYRRNRAEKRGGKLTRILDELSDILPKESEKLEDAVILKDSINRFLAALETRERVIFLRRYFYADTIGDIAFYMGLGRGNVAVILSRCRKKLKAHLESEGYSI